MKRPVNLLPWRARRRSQRLRLWAALFLGGGAAVVIFTLCWVAFLKQAHVHLTAQVEAASRLEKRQAALIAQAAQRERRLKGLVEQHRQQMARQAAVTAWQERLTSLAEILPETLWLTTLSATQETLLLEGHAQQPEALARLQQRLRALPGFSAVAAGETVRDEKGVWRFSFSLYKEAKHGATP